MDKYVVIYNNFVDITSPYFLNQQQLYLYSILYSRRNIGWGNLEISIDLLAQIVIFLIGKEKPSRNKNRIKEILLQLKLKGVIDFDNVEFKNDTLLDITFPNMDNGFEKIDVDILKKTNVPEELYIYYFVTRFKKGFKQSYEDIGNKLGCKKSNAGKIINNMINNKLIIKEPGEYKANGKQEINTYYLYKEKEQKKEKEKVKTEESKHIYDFNTGHWFTDERLDVNDFVIYLQSNNEIFKKECEIAIQKMSNSSEGGRKFVDNSLIKAKKIVQGNLEKENKNNQKDLDSQIRFLMKKYGCTIVRTKTSDQVPFKEVSNISDIIGVYYNHGYDKEVYGEGEKFVSEGFRYKRTDNPYNYEEILKTNFQIKLKDVVEITKKEKQSTEEIIIKNRR